MSILCKWDTFWYLAHFAQESRKLWSVSCGLKMPNHGGFVPVNNNIGRNMDSTVGITFYPEIRYKGARVWPRSWKTDTIEPVLCGFADVAPVHLSPGVESRKAEQVLLDAGWKWEMRDGLVGYVHVDDLEKIEGPPPDGPF